MKILILKTDISNASARNRVQPVFDNHPDIQKWAVDTEDIDKVLRIEATDNLSYSEVILLMRNQNFYCKELTLTINKYKQKNMKTDMKAKLSTMWIFVLLNVIFRDIHELFRPGFLEEMMTGIVNGVQLTEEFMLLAGILLEIPIAMVLLSRVLEYRVNRWANIIAGAITIAFIFANRPKDLDDMWFYAIEVVALLLIIWYAWKWSKPSPQTQIN